ncbi:MAG: hypothetical protein HXY45_02895 [Syntrophaceae bacterium]|nr:hypothetical protein [Syntrophaceae bacterium]
MKGRTVPIKPNLPVRIPLFFSNRKEKDLFLASVQQLDEQSDRLGILDPPETEPAILYSPMEEKK